MKSSVGRAWAGVDCDELHGDVVDVTEVVNEVFEVVGVVISGELGALQ